MKNNEMTKTILEVLKKQLATAITEFLTSTSVEEMEYKAGVSAGLQKAIDEVINELEAE